MNLNIRDYCLCIALILLVAVATPQIWPSAHAQERSYFAPAEEFHIPSQNGTVSFAVNGSYSSATLRNDVWIFEDLWLNGSQPLETLDVSTKNSDIIIFSHLSYDILRRIALLAYFAEGQGTQTLNIGIEAGESQGGINFEWSVIANGEFIAQGNSWSIKPDGTLSIYGLKGNVTILYFSLEDQASNDSLPFTQKHSVVLATGTALMLTVAVCVAVRVKNRNPTDQDNDN